MAVQAEGTLLPADGRTRHKHKHKYRYLPATCNQCLNSFFVKTIPDWNSLPEGCITQDTATAFQSRMRYPHSAPPPPPPIGAKSFEDCQLLNQNQNQNRGISVNLTVTMRRYLLVVIILFASMDIAKPHVSSLERPHSHGCIHLWLTSQSGRPHTILTINVQEACNMQIPPILGI